MRWTFYLAQLTVFLLASSGVANPSTMAPRVVIEDRLDADFVIPQQRPNGSYPWVVVHAIRRQNLDTTAVRSSVRAAVGSCRRKCSADRFRTFRVKRFAGDDSSGFQVAFTDGAARYRLTWRPTNPFVVVPPVSSRPNSCGGETHWTTLLGRNATASGQVFGYSVSTKDELEPDSESVSKLMGLEDCE